MVALPGAGVPIALMIIPLVAVGVEAEAMAVRQSPEVTAVAVATAEASSLGPAHHAAAAEASCLGGLPAMLLRHPLPGGLEVFKKTKKNGRKAGMGTGT